MEQTVFVPPEKAFAKNIYHFHSYKRKTFSTFFTGLAFWDTQADYYKQGSEAAKKLNEFIRVFLVDKISDLQKPVLREQINLDYKAGIKIYLCKYTDVQKYLPDPDFGYWDDKYLCIVPFVKDNAIDNIRITDKKTEINKAQKWIIQNKNVTLA